MITSSRDRQAGQALVLVALGMIMLLGAAGLAIDVGYLRFVHRSMQNAADSAAIAGTNELNYSDYVTAAKTDAATNGFTDGSSGVTVSVNDPPTQGSHVGTSGFLEVIISKNVPTLFMKALGVSTASVSARAVGHRWNGPACIYALDPTATNAILVNGSNSVSAQCGVMDDSKATQAFLDNGNGSFVVTSIGVTGGYLNNGGGTLTPTPSTGLPPLVDPLAYLSPPTVSSCSATTLTINDSGTHTVTPGSNCYNLTMNGSPTVTLNPGEYYRILANGTPTVIFNSGVYIIDGGALTINGENSVTGTGVTFYITGGASATLNGGSSFNLSAPTSGSYEGILLFQDRTDSQTVTVNGNNSSIINGALYAADAQITYNGSGPASAYSIIVADKILFNGNSTINDDYTGLTDGSPIKTAILAE